MDAQEAKTIVGKWGADHPEWRPFFTPTNAAIIEDFLITQNKPIVARSLTEAFEVLAREGKILSTDGSAPPIRRPRAATAVLNPETPPPQSGPSAAEQEYERFYHANSMLKVKERIKADGGFKKWLEGQTRAATLHPTGTAQPADPLAPSDPKPVFVAWKFVDLGPDAPQQPRRPGGVKVYLPKRGRLVAGVDTNKRTLALAEPEWGGLHFTLSDARLLVSELSRQSEPAEIR